MDNKEGTFMGIGAMAIACLCYFYQQYKQERLEYKAKKKILQERCRATMHQPIDFEAIRRGEKQLVLLPAVSEYTVSQSSYCSVVRSRRKEFIAQRVLESIRENQAGGEMEVRVAGHKLSARINNCHIEEEALNERREKCILFPENRHKNAENSTLTYTLKTAQRLALFASISYSLPEHRFILQPEFIVLSRGEAEAVMGRLAEFWQEKVYRATFWKLLLAFSIAAVGYALIYRPIRGILRRRQEKFGEVSKARLSHFGEKSQFRAKLQGKLVCEVCKNSNVNVIYECGHLSICENCHAANLSQRCPLCNKPSPQSIKIFL